MQIELKRAGKEDVDDLQKISQKTFADTFGKYNTPENIRKYLSENYSVEKLLQEINNRNSQFFFAKIQSQIIGYLKINFNSAQTELQEGNSLEIERIYVAKEFQGKKVGQSFMDKAVEIARENKLRFIWLGVWEKNLNAISFYQRNGFVIFGNHVFKLGEDLQTDIMMKMELDNKKWEP